MSESKKPARLISNVASLDVLFYRAATRSASPFLSTKVKYADNRGGYHGIVRVQPIPSTREGVIMSSQKVLSICDSILKIFNNNEFWF